MPARAPLLIFAVSLYWRPDVVHACWKSLRFLQTVLQDRQAQNRIYFRLTRCSR